MPVTSPDPRTQQQPAAPPPPGYGPPFAPQRWPVQSQRPAAPQRPKKPPMSTRKVALIAVACVIGASLLIGLGLGALRLLAGASGNASSSDREVRVVDCSAAGGRFDIVGAQAEVEVTNKSSRSHSYTVTVSFTDASGSTQYATGSAFIQDVAPGQSGRGKATSWQGNNSSISSCKITKVSRSGF